MPKFKVTTADGTEVVKGDTVIDFRGDPRTFIKATRAPENGKSAKVQLADREVYAAVVNLTVEEL